MADIGGPTGVGIGVAPMGSTTSRSAADWSVGNLLRGARSRSSDVFLGELRLSAWGLRLRASSLDRRWLCGLPCGGGGASAEAPQVSSGT